MEVIYIVFMSILGSVFASFFGVVISRVPENKSIVKPNSHCENCNHELKWYENIPLISYIVLGGKCKECKSKIGISSFIYELLGLLIGFLVAYKYPCSIEGVLIFIIAMLFLLMAGYDYKTQTILDIMWILLAVFEVILFLYRVLILKQDYLTYLISFAVGSFLFILIKLIGLLIKKDLVGTGDVIVYGVACLSFPAFGVLLSLLASCLPGSIIESIKMVKNKEKNDTTLAFLPYLCAGLLISMLYASEIYELLWRII